MQAPRIWSRLGALAVLALGVALVSILSGTAGIEAGEALEALWRDTDATVRTVLLGVRVPRLLAAFGVGSVLALAGVLLQALFRNPLADPYVLGVSGGAAVGALLAMLAGAGTFFVQSAAVTGALAAVAIVYVLARGSGVPQLLLTGIVMASACGALVAILLALADAMQLRGMVFWLAGDLGWASSPVPGVTGALLAATLAIVLARPLNVLAAGELRARSVGLDYALWRGVVIVACALLTSLAVVSAGTVGFVGLVTPHAVRLLFRTSDHRIVAPASALLGGTLLAAADLIARTVASPRQLPVGAIMALVGAPLFVALLRNRSRQNVR
jgi:iron complex transport system permease protein